MRHILITSLFVLFLLGSHSTPSLAVSITLPPTGQTTCQDMDGLSIPCAGTGQDGELRKGVPLSGPRFTDNGDETVTDNLTTLVWARDANLLFNRDLSFDTDGFGDPDGRISTKTALAYIEKLNAESFGGHNDWRLPNRNELMSLIDTEHANPALPTGHPFLNVQNTVYGTNSADKGRPVSFTWLVNMKSGTVGTGYSDSFGSVNFWPVRGGSWSGPAGKAYLPATNQNLCYDYSSYSSSPVPCATTSGQDGNLQKGVVWPEPRFSGFDDGFVRDTLTNLVWTASSNTPGPVACNPGVDRTWQEAFAYIACLNTNAYLGSSNWRMPNRNELSSLSYIEGEFPPIDHPFDVNNSYFLFHSSTPVAADSSTVGESEEMNAWTVRMDGWVSMQGKSAAYPVWPVRDFQIVLPTTGQATVYATGDDGSTRRGLTAEPPRFVNLGDTVYDTLTGLTWARYVNADGPEICVPYEPKDRAGAFTFIDCLNSEAFLGYIDWRLPNRNELMSLVDSGQANPALPAGHPFQEMPPGGASFWTSSRGEFSGYGWHVDFSNGTTGPETLPGQTHHVWAVHEGDWEGPPTMAFIPATGQTTPDGAGSDGDLRLGVAWPAPRFSDNGNGTVIDNLTALIWSQDANTPDRTCNLDTTLSWADAIAHVACLNTNNYLGFNDWRLPNRRELASIIDMEQRSPALPAGHPFSNVQNTFNYWSSTTAAADTTKAIVIGMGMGSEKVWDKTLTLPVWPIRGEGSYLIPDTISPVITEFTLPELSISANVSITAFTATDNVGVTGYCARTIDDPAGCLWSDTPPTTYNFGSAGSKTLYAFARDAAGNIAVSVSATVTIVLPASGICGSAHNGVFFDTPIANLCTQGTPSDVAGVGPWGWSCSGTLGGLTANCTADITVTVSLPRTGQVSCFDAIGDATSCFATGQDGDARAGLILPVPRFVENGDATVTDTLTGLIWPINANIMKTRDPAIDADDTPEDGLVTWQHALDYVLKLNQESYLGFNDWRLPNINELQSLVDSGYSNPAINGIHPFVFLDAGDTLHYWSSTTAPHDPQTALMVGLNNNGNISPMDKLNVQGVWPVRGNQSGLTGEPVLGKTGQSLCFNENGNVIPCAETGQDGELRAGVSWPTERFFDNGDGTLYDMHTTLIWSMDAASPGPDTCTPGVTKTWQNALDYVACLNSNIYLGYNDWRLPNRLELTSLYNRGTADTPGWLMDSGFSNVPSYSYWSSTNDPEFSHMAFSIFLTNGLVPAYPKGLSHWAWPVRGGAIYDDQLPTVDDFSLPLTASSSTVTISTFIASDNYGISGYLVTESATPPAADDPGWSADAPTSYTFTDTPAGVATDKTLYAWARDTSWNISTEVSATVTILIQDTVAPTVTFVLPATATAATVDITSYTAGDNVEVTGYLLTETATPPTAGNAGWVGTPPPNYTFSGIPVAAATPKTLYAWAKDAAGNVSAELSATVTITIPDTTPPTVAFVLPAGSNTAVAGISTFTATDDVAVTGYLLTETATPPTAGDTGWSGTPPVSYTFSGLTEGVATPKTLYAWAKDAAGNVSAELSATVTITIPDTTPPTVTFVLPATSSAALVSISTFTAIDNIAVTGYKLTESATPPAAGAAGWRATAPASYTFSGLTVGTTDKTLYSWAKDAAGNVSTVTSATVSITIAIQDTIPPSVNFSMVSTSAPLTVPVQSFTASDINGVIGYCLSENSDPATCSWQETAPDSYTFSAYGATTIYAYARDSFGNIGSTSRAINLFDMTPPFVFLFTVGNTQSLTAPITAFTAIDNGTLNAYCATEASDPGNCVWQATAPTSYTFSTYGDRLLYAFVRDLAGNVSAARSDLVSVTDNSLPFVSSFTVTGTAASLTAQVTAFTATDNDRVSGYCIVEINNSAGCAWQATPHTSYTFATSGPKSLYAFVRDPSGNIGFFLQRSVSVGDRVPPATPTVTLQLPITSATVTITSFTSTDNVGVSGYCLTEVNNSNGCNWAGTPPAHYSFVNVPEGTLTLRTLYAWVRDAFNNVSLPRTVTVPFNNLSDTTAPVISAFTLLGSAESLTVSVASFAAADNLAVTGYCVTETNSPDGCVWQATPPTDYVFATEGDKTLYAFAVDAAGNITGGTPASVNITLYPVRISSATPVYYPTLQGAYNGAAPTNVIELKAGSLINDLLAISEISVTLEGGAYGSSPAGNTVIKGVVRIRAGKIFMKKIAIAPLDAGV